MKNIISISLSFVFVTMILTLAFGDQIIQYHERMVGAGHPTLADTLNRGFLIQHDADGVHTIVPWSTITNKPTTTSGYGITDAMVSDNVNITGGTISGVTISGSMGGSVTFDNIAITGGTIQNVSLDNTVIGGTTPKSGTFTEVGTTCSYYDNNCSIVVMVAGDPTGSDLVGGAIWMNGTTNQIKYRNSDNTVTYTIGLTDAVAWDNVTGKPALVTADNTVTFTNKSFNAADTGNVLTQYKYLSFSRPAAKTYDNTYNKIVFQKKFDNATDKESNCADYWTVVPFDVDTGVEIGLNWKFILGDADTGGQVYVATNAVVADSSNVDPVGANEIALGTKTDASGAQWDVESLPSSSTFTTATGWAATLVAGRSWRIAICRDGDDAADTSTVDSYSHVLTIRYGSTQ